MRYVLLIEDNDKSVTLIASDTTLPWHSAEEHIPEGLGSPEFQEIWDSVTHEK